jgi:hypothetical protein
MTLPAVTAMLFVAALVGLIIDPPRGLIAAVLFVGCALDPGEHGKR